MITRPQFDALPLSRTTTPIPNVARHHVAPRTDEAQLPEIKQVPRVRSRVSNPEDGPCYRIAKNRREFRAAFHLVYRNYRKAGLIDANPYGMRVTRFHLHPETTVCLGLDGGEVVSTVTVIGDTAAGLPMDCIYFLETDEFRARGWRVAEVSCLASTCDPSHRGFLTTFVRLNSLMAQSARLQGIDHLLIVVHPRHAPFYEKYVGFKSTEIVRPYPAVENHPALLLTLDLERMHLNSPKAYQRFFGKPLPIDTLRPRPMSASDCRYFDPAADVTCSFVPVPMAG